MDLLNLVCRRLRHCAGFVQVRETDLGVGCFVSRQHKTRHDEIAFCVAGEGWVQRAVRGCEDVFRLVVCA